MMDFGGSIHCATMQTTQVSQGLLRAASREVQIHQRMAFSHRGRFLHHALTLVPIACAALVGCGLGPSTGRLVEPFGNRHAHRYCQRAKFVCDTWRQENFVFLKLGTEILECHARLACPHERGSITTFIGRPSPTPVTLNRAGSPDRGYIPIRPRLHFGSASGPARCRSSRAGRLSMERWRGTPRRCPGHRAQTGKDRRFSRGLPRRNYGLD
jgi:hypothetical protein